MTIHSPPPHAAVVYGTPVVDGVIVVQGTPVVEMTPTGPPLATTTTTSYATPVNFPEQSTPSTTMAATAVAPRPPDQEKTTFCCGLQRTTLIVLLSIVAFLVVAAAAGVGLAQIKEEAYVCGSNAPSKADLNSTGLPICLRVSYPQGFSDKGHIAQRPLCLAKPRTNNPPMWCYEDVDDTDSEDYYLWWSPCDKCGTAWRMFKKKKDDESWYKLPADQPDVNEMPPLSSTGWMEWTRQYNGGQWQNTTVRFSDCSQEDGIPNGCFRDDLKYPFPSRILKAIGFSGFVIALCSLCCLGGCCRGCHCGGGGGGYSHSSYGAGCGGGGGGGGGGCGGGGGDGGGC